MSRKKRYGAARPLPARPDESDADEDVGTEDDEVAEVQTFRRREQAPSSGEEASQELEELDTVLATVTNALAATKPGGFLSRLTGGRGEAEATRTAREALERSRVTLLKLKTRAVELAAAQSATQQERSRAEQLQAELEADRAELEAEKEGASTALVTTQQNLDTQLEAVSTMTRQANDLKKKAEEQLRTVDEARGRRDEAMSGYNTLRSKILGLARHFKAPIETADHEYALRWCLDNLKKKDVAPPEDVTTKLIRLEALADVETFASRKLDLGELEGAKALNELAGIWRKKDGLEAASPMPPSKPRDLVAAATAEREECCKILAEELLLWPTSALGLEKARERILARHGTTTSSK